MRWSNGLRKLEPNDDDEKTKEQRKFVYPKDYATESSVCVFEKDEFKCKCEQKHTVC